MHLLKHNISLTTMDNLLFEAICNSEIQSISFQKGSIHLTCTLIIRIFHFGPFPCSSSFAQVFLI